MPPAARITDLHSCPAHGGGPVVSGSPNTVIGHQPAARVTDGATCGGAVDAIARGSSNVLINSLQAARLGDPTLHTGVVASGDPTVIIGETPQSYALVAAAHAGKPFCQECELVRRQREEASAAAAALSEAERNDAVDPPHPEVDEILEEPEAGAAAAT